MSEAVARAKGRLGNAVLRGDAEAISEARRVLAVEKILTAIERARADAPALRPEDVHRIIQALG